MRALHGLREEDKMSPAVVQRILSPTDWKARQLGNLKAVGEANYGVGIDKPKKDPIEAGKAAEGAYASEMRKVIDEGRRKKGLEGATMAEWNLYASTIGKGRLVEGVTKREAKVGDFVTKYQPLLSDHVGKIDALPSATDGEREAKMLENLRGLKALHGRAR